MKTRYADCDRPLMCLPVDSDPRCTLMEGWHIFCRDLIIDIPVGTRTDGASIPRFLWRICGHPLETPRAYAALAHDYLYEHGAEFGVSRLEADLIYHDLSRHFGISRLAAAVEFLALRFFGASHYTPKTESKESKTERKAE